MLFAALLMHPPFKVEERIGWHFFHFTGFHNAVTIYPDRQVRLLHQITLSDAVHHFWCHAWPPTCLLETRSMTSLNTVAAVLCCAALCCAVLCCAVLCCLSGSETVPNLLSTIDTPLQTAYLPA